MYHLSPIKSCTTITPKSVALDPNYRWHLDEVRGKCQNKCLFADWRWFSRNICYQFVYSGVNITGNGCNVFDG